MELAIEMEKGFEAAAERMTASENRFETFMTEAHQDLDGIHDRLKRYGKAVLAAGSDGAYAGFWRDEEEAKSFGQIVLQVGGIETKDMTELSNTAGGFLVPTELAARIIDMMRQYGVYRQFATRIKLGTSSQKVPAITADLTTYCPAEGGTITKSDIMLGLVGIEIKKFASFIVINSELDEDSVIGLGEICGTSMARSMAKKEDLIGFRGDGTSTFFGMVGITGALLKVDETIANIKGLQVASGNAYSEIVLDDFEALIARLPDDADAGARWFVNRKFFFSVMHKLARAAGASDMFNILSNEKTRWFLGYPVTFTAAMPGAEADNQICAVLADLSLGAFLAERRVLEIAKSTEFLFQNDQIAIRSTQRIDIVPFGVGNTTESGPICGLITAAS